MAISRPRSRTRIVRHADVLEGEPTVRGTRVSVRTIVVAYRGWGDIAHILREYSPLTRADVEDALAYYEDHRDETDRNIRENLDD